MNLNQSFPAVLGGAADAEQSILVLQNVVSAKMCKEHESVGWWGCASSWDILLVVAAGRGPLKAPCFDFLVFSRRAIYKPGVPLNNVIGFPAPNSEAYSSYLEFKTSVYTLVFDSHKNLK